MPHRYLTFSVSEGNTILGEQRKVIEDLYSILAHTGSTNSGFEFLHTPWTREPYGNFAPHGWFHSCLHGTDPKPAGARGGHRGRPPPRWRRCG